MTGTERMYRYINDVKSKKILTNQYIKLAVRRFEKDLERSKKNDPDFPYVFDERKANRFIQFSEALKLYKNEMKGKPQVFGDWQCFAFCQIYGWVHKETGFRRFRKAFMFVARQNGKSHMCASSLLWDVLTTNGGEGVCAATKKEQAKIAWTVCKEMIKQNDALSRRLKIYNSTSRIVSEANASYIEATASTDDKLDGKSCSVIVADELAAQRNYDMIKVLMSGAGSRPESLCLEITSGSDNLQSPGKGEFDLSVEILNGIKQDETFFCVLYCLDPEDDWKNPNLFIKANPALNVAIKEEWLKNQLKEALNNPSLEGEFRTKNLNQWLNPLKAWLQPKIWNPIVENGNKLKIDFNKPFYSVGAIDLSKRSDLTAFTVCTFQDDMFFLHHHFYFPLESLREKIQKDNEMWFKWVEMELVTGTPGRTIDYEYLKKDIENAITEYDIQSILYDPYNATQLTDELQDRIDMVEVNQSMRYLSPFIKTAEEIIFSGKVADANPVTRWMANNCMVYRDPNDNMKIIKSDKDSPLRIDGIITSCMCIGYIKQQLDDGNVDLRDDKQRSDDLEKMLSELDI